MILEHISISVPDVLTSHIKLNNRKSVLTFTLFTSSYYVSLRRNCSSRFCFLFFVFNVTKQFSQRELLRAVWQCLIYENFYLSFACRHLKTAPSCPRLKQLPALPTGKYLVTSTSSKEWCDGSINKKFFPWRKSILFLILPLIIFLLK